MIDQATAGTSFSDIIFFSLSIHKLANPSAPVLTESAPLTPNFSLIKNTVTTKAFNGIPNKFKITLRCESGTYLDRSVPMEGKYIPTQDSKRKNEMESAPKIIAGVKDKADFVANVAVPIASVARVSIPAENFSPGTDILPTNWLNVVEPRRQHAMKQEKMVP